ncbi:class A beta-lactamase-related serine hydrolase [Streptomyces paludis]|uniref:Class A beta-lactamase-related serine hydrolase n=2 Tax=Streptomyces paludis TaxID=2282738 RepID=A0A345I0U5_9ACTN|nr:class A beta-lactamase-related serine hydrolase [Streptomyces paludis]
MSLLVAVALTGALTACDAAEAEESGRDSAVSTSATSSGAAVSSDAAASPRARLAELAQQVVDAGAPGTIVRVDDGSGKPVEITRQAPWTKADHALTASDKFRMGSNTKTMVATVVLQLVADNKLKLSDPVDAWLPGMIPGGSEITVRMLLNHTSGLFNYLFDPDVFQAFIGQDTKVWTPEEQVAAGVRHEAMFAPGTDYAYSNTNYAALGLIAEKATGQPLEDLVQRQIAGPLQLKNTYLVTGAGNAADKSTNPALAPGYEPDAARLVGLLPPGVPAGTAFSGPAKPEGHVETTWINPSTTGAAGGAVSTAREWATVTGALMSGKLLPPALMKEMRTTRAEEAEFPNRRYGLGLEEVATPCGTVWGHNGEVPGYSSENYTDAAGRRTVSVYTTTIFGIASPKPRAAQQALMNAAVCAMLGKPVPATPAPAPTGS